MTSNNIKPKWYKNPIVWMLIFFPSAAIIAGFVTLFIAIESDDGLVDNNYYKQGLGINKTITSDTNAINKNVSGLMSINSATGELQTKFSEAIKAKLGKSLEFKLVHRTIPGFDQQTTLNQVDGTLLYTGKIKPLPESGGRWRWEIKHDDWRISEVFLTNKDEVIIHTFPSATEAE